MNNMKSVLAVLLFLFVTASVQAISVEEIAKLSKLRTSDDLLIQIIQKDKLEKPLSSRDILFLKEQGVSDRVLAYLMQTSRPKQNENENLRVFQTTNKKGKQITVVTNMDEKGNRLGPELPPEAKQEPAQYPPVEQPREVYVILKDESERSNNNYDDEYVEPAPPQGGIPLNDTYYPGYSPYFSPYYYPRHYKSHFRNSNFPNQNPNQANWRVQAKPPQTRASASRPSTSRPSSPSRSPSSGTRFMRRR